jgi:hypothetical protein
MSRRRHVADARLRFGCFSIARRAVAQWGCGPGVLSTATPMQSSPSTEIVTMLSLAQSMFLDSELRVEQELPHAGSALENPFVYDAVARELKQMAQRGLVEIVQEHSTPGGEPLIDSLRYRRVRVG